MCIRDRVSIERLASAEAVTRRYADRSGGLPSAGADVVFGRLAQGDPVAAAVVNEAVSAPVSYTHLDVYKRQ